MITSAKNLYKVDLSVDEIARKVRSIDIIKDAVHILRKEIMSCTFGLENKTHGPMER